MTTERRWPISCGKRGVDVSLRDYAGVTHEFFGMGAVVEKARQAEGAVADDLKQSFSAK